ncbi:tRNA lysidine(34) synthetase TilS [Shimia sp. W99]
MPVTLQDRLAEGLAGVFPENERSRIGVAVSGGGDSMALLDLLRVAGWELAVVSVNHGLREEAAEEIALVAEYCARFGIAHEVLAWGWDGRGSVQAAARDGRRALISDWAKRRGIGHVALGHTADDQAETVLMRLGRGSGVDGLAAMAPVLARDGIVWLRPLLDVRRAELRDHLRQAGLVWADDPSNDDPAYDRIKARQALELLAPLGVSVERLTRTAAHMARARAALDYAERQLVAEAVTFDAGDVVIALAAFDAAPEELRTRVVARALNWVSGQVYKPRFDALQAALAAETTTALHGCLVIRKGGCLRITREWAAVAGVRCDITAAWDGRWRLDGPGQAGLEIAALGEAGIAECPDWRATGRPRVSVLASPAIWQGARLVAAPLAGRAEGWSARITGKRADFF